MGDVKKIRVDKKVKKETKIEEIGDNVTSKIDKLNNDCLLEIFQYLPTIADRIRIERVSKRWQILSQRSWYNFKSLDFKAKTWGLKPNFPGEKLIRSIDVDKVIRLSGRYLTSISTDVGKFARICHLLPKIRELQLVHHCQHGLYLENVFSYGFFDDDSIYEKNECTYEHDDWQEILSWLMSHGKNITSFQIKIHHCQDKEEAFTRMLREMKNLKSFYIHDCPYFVWSGTCLFELPFETIEEIILTSSFMQQPFDNSLLTMMINKCKKLQTLGIEVIEEPGSAGIFEALPSQAASLKNLKLKSDVDRLSNHKSVLLSTMSALVHLEKLDVSGCEFFTDAFLEVVGKNCKMLKYLDVSDTYVTDVGISSICGLQKLAFLTIAELPEIRNPPLEKLTSLVVLDSFANENLQEECLCSFLKKADQLRAINVKCCYLVTEKLLNVAVEVAKLRDSNNPLDLYYFEEDEVNPELLSEKPSLLNLISSDVILYDKYGYADPFLEINGRPDIGVYRS